MKGIVKTWKDGRGFGFIEPEGDQDDVFVHYSNLRGTFALRRGQRVEFELEDTYKGPRATDVKILG
jgi:CspA family cold shock protein